MAQKTAPYVFPLAELEEFGFAVANRFKACLLQGAPELGWRGLNDGPQFTNRKGTGAGRDETLTTKATVVFYDDGRGALPHVMIVGITANGGREEWGDDEWLVECTATLDCYANQAMPNATSPGINAKTADEVLGSFVWGLVDTYEVMTHWGFTNPQVKPEAQGAMNRDGTPFEFHFPLTVSFEVYMSRHPAPPPEPAPPSNP